MTSGDPDLQAAHAAAPWVVTWDDHEVANNFADAVPQYDQSPERFLLRRAAASQAYYEHLPLRRSSIPNGPTMLLYRRLRFGDLAELFVLDTRQYRTDQPCGDGQKPRCEGAYDPDATMMGPEQERWLMDGMRASGARWNVLANQVVIAQMSRVMDGERTFSMDKWDGYLKLNFDDPSSAIVATEFVGTSMTSGGDGRDGARFIQGMQEENPHLKFCNCE